jgi:mono/diheme cytochrome c family protein
MSPLWSQDDSSHLNHHPKVAPSMSRQNQALIYLVITVVWMMTSLFNSSAVIYAQPNTQVSVDSEAEQNFRELEGERARELFKERCVRCHGVRGDGRGVLASHLSPRPTDLTNPTWYKKTPKDNIKRVILGGGGALGKSIIMPANPDLRTQPKLVTALVDYIIKLVPRDDESKSNP